MQHIRTTAALLALAALAPLTAFAQGAPPPVPPAQERPYGREKGREFRRELPPEAKALIARQHQETGLLRDRHFQEMQALRQKHHQERQAMREKLVQERLAGGSPAAPGGQAPR